jgi:hypothetical protein
LLEVLLYGAYPKVMVTTLVAVSRASFSLSLSLLVPSLWFTLPLWAGIVVVSSVYSHRPAQVGEPVLVTLEHNGRDGHGHDWNLKASPQFDIDVDSFRHPSKPQQFWRLRPLSEGDLTLEFTAENGTAVKSLKVGGRSALLSSGRNRLGWNWLASPLEAPLPSGFGLNFIAVEYPERTLAWQGWSAPWWLVLLLAFLAWSWLLALVLPPGNRPLGRQPDSL